MTSDLSRLEYSMLGTRGTCVVPTARLMDAMLPTLKVKTPQKQTWEQMHLTDGPTEEAYIYLEWQIGDGESMSAQGSACAKVWAYDGITLDAVASALRTPSDHVVESHYSGQDSHDNEDLLEVILAYEGPHGPYATMRISGILLEGMLIPSDSGKAILDSRRVQE